MKITAEHKAQMIISHAKRHGGTPSAIARELGISYTASVRKHVSQLEPHITKWRHAFKRFGHWLTLPTELATNRNEQMVDCVCTNCGAHKSVRLLNLISGRSIACRHCAMQNRQNLRVTDGDAETHRSIRAFAKAIGQPEKYQSLRHSLIAGKTVEHDDKVYSLAEYANELTAA